MPFSISSFASSNDFFDRSACDQVWLPMACPAATTCFRTPGSHMACLPIGKKIALVHCSASAASTAGVWRGHGPSSKVSTTSPGCRKSWLLKCSKPKPGPPVVSTSTTRPMPSALGLPGQDTVLVGAGGAAPAGAAGRAGPWAKVVGRGGAAVSCCGATARDSGTSAPRLAEASVVIGLVDKATGSADGPETAVAPGWPARAVSAFVRSCSKMAPNTARNATMTSVQAAAIKRMAASLGLPKNLGHRTPQYRHLNEAIQRRVKVVGPPIPCSIYHCGYPCGGRAPQTA